MPDMYDKLGEMLNEALESGRIPTDHNCKAEDQSNPNTNDQETASEKSADSGHFSFKKDEKPVENDKKSAKKTQKTEIPTGEVIKMHEYAYNMQFPPQIQSALTTLDIVYPFTQKDISVAYHKKLKEVHPDTKNTIQISESVYNSRHITVDEIKKNYQILSDFFGIK